MAGNASTAHGTHILSTPAAKNARLRARLCGLHHELWVAVMYRRAHCCSDVAKRAHVMLITRLKNQSEFTQMAYIGGENGGGVATVEGKDVPGAVPFGSARI